MSRLGGSSVTDMVLGGVGLFTLALLVFMAKAVRAEELERRNRGCLRMVAGTADRRAVLRLDERVVEFDAAAYEYFAGRGDEERLRISRALAAGKPSRCNAFMLAAIANGDPLPDEDVYEERVPDKGTRFWTRSEIRADEAAARRSPDVWRWYTAQTAG